MINLNKMINRYWRDWAAHVYLFICLCDFFVGPLWWNLLMWGSCDQVVAAGGKCDATRWVPLTLQMGGMFHISFGAILSATAWKKHQELEVNTTKSNNNT